MRMWKPTFSVNPGMVEFLFTSIDVYPSLLVITVDLDPDVIFTVPDPPDSRANCTTEHAEAVGKFSHSSFPGLQQCPHI